MNEELLQFIWQNRLYEQAFLLTHNGEKVEIIHVGSRSNNSGPDFINARVIIAGTTWVGNTELHCFSSDWYKHGHDKDKAYDNVILHVVYKNNAKVYRSNGEEIPTLELAFNPFYEHKYQELKVSHYWIPCKMDFFIEDEFKFRSWLERICIERMEQKARKLQSLLDFYKNDWEESFYCAMASSLGYKINAQPFEMLAKSLPLKTLLRHKDNLFQIESLLFGQAGFLSASLFDDDYFTALKKEYLFLRKKYRLKPMENHLWQFMRLRPASFPTLRIAQLASFIFHTNSLFSKLIESRDMQIICADFRIEPSEYWNTHYQFNKSGTSRLKHAGAGIIDIIIINTVVPFLFLFGNTHRNQELKDRAIEFLIKIKAESNSIINGWKSMGVKATDAMSSQALIQLKNEYCNRRRCLNCQIGIWILAKKQ